MIKPGDKLTRMLAGTVPMEMEVEFVDDEFIFCVGGWKFNKEFGYEIDEDLGWGVPDADGKVTTGSYLLPKSE